MRRLDRRYFDDGAAQIAAQHFQATVNTEWIGSRAQHTLIQTVLRGCAPHELVGLQGGLVAVVHEAVSCHRAHIAVQQACRQQFTDGKARAASSMEVVNVGAAVGINPCQQRHHARQRVKVIPIDDNPCRPGNGYDMNGVIG